MWQRRDLSGNKRTSKTQSFDQTFKDNNKALRVSWKNGYPVRVVRSYKEKRSSYAPEKGLQYDGIYRIEKCWRKVGTQGCKVCRYLFIRCDNEPAPWTSDEHGDHPRPLPEITELQRASDIFERTEIPSWDYDEEDECWKWKRPAPASLKRRSSRNDEVSEGRQKKRRATRKPECTSVKEKLLKGFTPLLIIFYYRNHVGYWAGASKLGCTHSVLVLRKVHPWTYFIPQMLIKLLQYSVFNYIVVALSTQSVSSVALFLYVLLI